MQAKLTYALTTPIEHAGKTYETLVFPREATVSDAVAMDAVKGEISKSIALVASMCDVPIPALKKMTLTDLNALMPQVAPLMGKFTSDILADGET